MTAFFGDGDGGRGRWRRGHRSLDTTNTKQFLLGRPTANVTRATRASPAPTYDARALSVH